MKQTYVQLIYAAVSAYSRERILAYTERVRADGLREHGYPRLTANIGFLLSQGLRDDLIGMFPDMMDLTCSEIRTALKRYRAGGKSVSLGNDFSVKETVLTLIELEKSGVFPREMTDRWRDALSCIVPADTYNCIAPVPPVRVGNWAAFAAAGEQARIWAGLGHECDFVENQIESQLLSFDENGMYRDPHEPAVYDVVARLQLALALYCGYDGEGRVRLERELRRSAGPTLLMQSVTGEMPFGGRSNQFLHNDTALAALCEYYATLFWREGDSVTAGQFKSAARLACESTGAWLTGNLRHIKNRYPTDSRIGCEGYGYFDKYMVTMGSFAYLAYLFSDDTVGELPCPARYGSHAFLTSPFFHRLFLQAGGYTAQFELDADPAYDAGGLGRLQKAGLSSVLCLSVPFAARPNYTVPAPNPSSLSVAPCVIKDGVPVIPDKWELDRYGCDGDTAFAALRSSADGVPLCMDFRLCCDGARICSENPVALPVFLSDGAEQTERRRSDNQLYVTYRGGTVVYRAAGLSDTGIDYANRNGIYRLYIANGPLDIRMG